MKTTTTILAALLVVASSSALACEEQVLGESLDSGLGEFVYGEGIDSGLGELGPDYTGHDFVRVLGESLDSGLGSLTRQDVAKLFSVKSTLRASADR
jgi:hypothetical protein